MRGGVVVGVGAAAANAARPAVGKPAGGFGAGAAIARPQPQSVIDIAAGATQPAFADQHSQPRCQAGEPERPGRNKHMSQRRRQRQCGDRLAMRRWTAVAVDRANRTQPRSRFGQSRDGRRIEPVERSRVGHAPTGGFEAQSGQLAFEDFRRIEAQPSGRFARRPKPDCDARCRPAGAAGALGDGSLAGALGDQSRHADSAIEPRAPRQAGIDDDADAIDGDGGFGDRCCQHDLAASGRRWPDGGALVCAIARAIEPVEIDISR